MPYRCEWCQHSSFVNPIDDPCFGCSNFFFSTMQADSMVALHSARTFSLPQHIMRTTIEYVHWDDPTAEFRRQYLLNMLVAGGSGFRLLTNFYNGMHGRISHTEDIIDRVVLFVVGECQDRVVSSVIGNIQFNAVW